MAPSRKARAHSLNAAIFEGDSVDGRGKLIAAKGKPGG